jgi:23S rRNA pseudouridine1911/1915/1917 synthase
MSSSLEIIYEDNHLLAVNKSAGMLTQPNESGELSLEEAAKQWIKMKYQKSGEVFLGTIHRLDKPVSGVVLFARTSKALSRLNEAIRSHQTKKLYWAWVEGVIIPEEGILENYLVHGEFASQVVKDPKESGKFENAKFAQLSYRTIGHWQGKEGSGSCLEIELATGRYHQIRAQLAAAGYPILGDGKYGIRQTYTDKGIALHHREFRIPHPTQEREMTFVAAFKPDHTLLEASSAHLCRAT